MKIKKIRRLKVNSYDFKVKWTKEHNGASFSYADMEIVIGTKSGLTNDQFHIICHELQEICATEMHVRYARPDIDSDYIFMYDHRQHDMMMNMFAGLLSQFIE